MLELAAVTIWAVLILHERFTVLFPLHVIVSCDKFLVSMRVAALIFISAVANFNPVVTQLSFVQTLFLGCYVIVAHLFTDMVCPIGVCLDIISCIFCRFWHKNCGG